MVEFKTTEYLNKKYNTGNTSTNDHKKQHGLDVAAMEEFMENVRRIKDDNYINFKGSIDKVEDLPASANYKDAYLVIQTNRIYVYTGKKFTMIK